MSTIVFASQLQTANKSARDCTAFFTAGARKRKSSEMLASGRNNVSSSDKRSLAQLIIIIASNRSKQGFCPRFFYHYLNFRAYPLATRVPIHIAV